MDVAIKAKFVLFFYSMNFYYTKKKKKKSVINLLKDNSLYFDANSLIIAL